MKLIDFVNTYNIKIFERLLEIDNDYIAERRLLQFLNNDYMSGDYYSPCEEFDIEYSRFHSAQKEVLKSIVDWVENDEVNAIYGFIYNLFARKWNRERKALTSSYEPLSNYDETETELTETNFKRNDTETNFINGFGSSTESQTDKKTTESVGTELNNKENITRNKSGKDSKNTYQELIQKELEIAKHNIIELMFNDLDSFLCESYY